MTSSKACPTTRSTASIVYRFGGNDDNDNSGVMHYVSIRHGGFAVPGQQGTQRPLPVRGGQRHHH